MLPNVDSRTVSGFGMEWHSFDQSALDNAELQRSFQRYFSIFPWQSLPRSAKGFDLGCGSGRWAKCVSTRVGELNCIDASSQALDVARQNLKAFPHCSFHHASAGHLPFPDRSMDFGYSLGVLHHVPDTGGSLRDCARILKPGAPFLVYLYYALENRPAWYRWLWLCSDWGRKTLSCLPFVLRKIFSEGIALLVYWPLARTARILHRLGILPSSFPLACYRTTGFYTMRTDALDRFGTYLEKRFTRAEIQEMMEGAGFEDILFSEYPPYWCAVARRSSE